MNKRVILSFLFFIFVVLLLLFYWIIPFQTINFGTKVSHSNFSISSPNLKTMQFYPNMRYQDSRISYKIHDCPLQKKNDIKMAFEIIEDKTILEFYPVTKNEEISVFCQSKHKIEGGLFIAGEGGPTNIIQTENFNVISKGKVLLIRDSECERPNVAIHELLHALGFEHSNNPNNVMYNISQCKQVIGTDSIDLLNELYSYPSAPDLGFEEASALKRGIYLDANISVRNNGLIDSPKSQILIYADEKFVKDLNLEPLEVGYGKIITIKNLWVKKFAFNKVSFYINSSFDELDKNNNLIVLEVKNKTFKKF